MPDLSNSSERFAALLAGRDGTPQIISFLEALAARGETAEDLAALVTAMRAQALPFPAMAEAIDVCGTGGDGLDTPNISTAVAFTVAACGVPVVKHGNRAASSRCGSADVLEALGVVIEAPPEVSARALREANLCFLFARHYHPAMRHVAEARRQIGKRTIFNLAGPLANPARPGRQLVGVYDKGWLRPMAEALRALGSKAAWVVHSRDGMDELSTRAASDVVCLKDGAISARVIEPAAYGLRAPAMAELRGGDTACNAGLLRGLFDGAPGALRDIVCLNAAAALTVAGRVEDIPDGLAMARQALDDGAARKVLETLVTVTRGS